MREHHTPKVCHT